MFGDIGWAELLVIGVVALIVIGPEDLPEMFRQLGRFTGKIRAMAREFQRAMDQAARESGVNDVAKDLKSATSAKSLGLNAVKEAADKFEKWDPLKPARSAAKPAASVAKPAGPASPAGGDATPAPASEAGPTPAPVAEGPATAALRARKEARKAVVKEMNDKLKAVDAGELSAPGPAVPPMASPSRKPRKKKAPEA